MTPFIILCAERTGSSVLSGLLDSHPECFVAGELFNPRLIETDQIPIASAAFRFDQDELVNLRKADPINFIEWFFDTSKRGEYRAGGFKVMYHHADTQADARDHLVSRQHIQVIHLKRRNLLRRLLSQRRAQLTDVWAEGADATGTAPPRVDLPFLYSVSNFHNVERKQAEYEERFKDHRILELYYEDLAKDPQMVASRALVFLGLQPPAASLEIRFRKTGADSLRDAIANYDELKANFLRWASFFEE